MKRSVLTALSVVLVLVLSSPGYSADGPYVSLILGTANVNDSELTDSTDPGAVVDMEYDTSYILGAALGYRHASVGFEGEIAYQLTDVDGLSSGAVKVDLEGDSSVLSLLLNGYYALVFDAFPIVPYLSAGVGLAQAKISDLKIPGTGALDWNGDDFVFCYQVGAGLEFDLTDRLNVGVKYRYFGTSEAEFNPIDAEFSSQSLMLVIKRSF